jgi:hypothetical protein
LEGHKTEFLLPEKAMGGGIGLLEKFRRTDLYGELRYENDVHAVDYGPVAEDAPKIPFPVATQQGSWYHSRKWTMTRALGQIAYSASRGANFGVFPEFFCFKRGEVEVDPAAAAQLSSEILAKIQEAAAKAHYG